jgi:hypothetical protein
VTEKAFENPENFYPTPEESPLAALTAASIRQPNQDGESLLRFDNGQVLSHPDNNNGQGLPSLDHGRGLSPSDYGRLHL